MRRFYFIPVCSAWLAACASSPQKHWRSDDLLVDKLPAAPERLTEAQASADVSFLLYALENGYGGRHYLPHGTFETALRRLREVHGTMSPAELRDRIDEILLAVPDNHLKARFNGKLSSARLAAKRIGSVGKNAISDPAKAWEVRAERHGGRRFAYVSLPKFPLHDDPVWKGFLERVKAALPGTDALVIDFRGNTGGDDEIGMDLAGVIFGRAFVHPISRQYVSQTPETFALSVNDVKLNAIKLREAGEPVPAHLAVLLKKELDAYGRSRAALASEDKVIDFDWKARREDPVLGYKKPIYILIDATCASSCESTVDAFEFHPTAKRVGENTAGQLQFGNVGYAVLPNSGIEVQIPTNHNEYFDKRFLEKVGIAPDIRVPPGADAYEFVKQALRKRPSAP